MDKIQKDINDALETTRKWNPLLMIFAMPLYVFLLIWGSYFPKGVLRLASEDGHELVTQLTSIENSLFPPASFFGFLFLFSLLCFISFYIISKRNRIKAYLLTQILQLILFLIFYYSWFIAALYLIPLVAIRIVYWIGFVLSLIYLIYILVTKQRASKDYFSSEYYKKFLNVILFLWLVTMVFLLYEIQS